MEGILGCSIGSFPCKYLGLPLCLKKPSAAQLSGLVEMLATRLPTCKAATLPKSGRLILVLLVLCSIPLHAMIALDLPMKTIAAMNKIIRGVLWCGKAQANGGHCSVAWEEVCTPRWAGGLGIPSLRWLNVAMQARWAWLHRVDRDRPWQSSSLPSPRLLLRWLQQPPRLLGILLLGVNQPTWVGLTSLVV